MSIACECGYQADSADDLTDHLLEIFAPDKDTGVDGLPHAEAAQDCPRDDGILTCLCGYAGMIEALDEHFLRMFTPADGTGSDGLAHGAATTTAYSPGATANSQRGQCGSQ